MQAWVAYQGHLVCSDLTFEKEKVQFLTLLKGLMADKISFSVRY